MEAMKKGAISMRLINECGLLVALTIRGMDADGMRQVVVDFQKEMMRNEINTGMIDDAFTEPDAGEVDAEVDKALFEVAGVKMSGRACDDMSWSRFGGCGNGWREDWRKAAGSADSVSGSS